MAATILKWSIEITIIVSFTQELLKNFYWLTDFNKLIGWIKQTFNNGNQWTKKGLTRQNSDNYWTQFEDLHFLSVALFWLSTIGSTIKIIDLVRLVKLSFVFDFKLLKCLRTKAWIMTLWLSQLFTLIGSFLCLLFLALIFHCWFNKGRL